MPLVDYFYDACSAKRGGGFHHRACWNVGNTAVAGEGHNAFEKSVFDGHEIPFRLRAAKRHAIIGRTPGRSVTSKATRFRVPCELRHPSKMDMDKMLNDLRMEREQISEAIMVMERLSLGQGTFS